mgnify:FL=1|tara:strand:+ start:469 stop:1050 length:582 start_codon:yes stop_codon:yes gene_type:complete
MSAGAIFGGLGVLGSVLQYRSTVTSGKVQKTIMEAQARNKRLEGRVEAVKAKESANEILRRTKRALASNLARGYSSGVLPEVGSAAVFSEQQVLRPAALDVGILEQDAFLAIEQSEREARNLEYRGAMAARQAQTQAITGLVMNVAQVGLAGAFSGMSLGGGSGYSASAFQGVSKAGTTNVPISSRVGPAFGG